VQWYRLAAAQSHPRAQHALGVCCFYGDGTQEDKAASVKWDTLAAAQGHAKAQYSLGVCYDNGEGVEQEDEEKAAEYYALAAEQVFEDYL
jgi:TPR repeat protein